MICVATVVTFLFTEDIGFIIGQNTAVDRGRTECRSPSLGAGLHSGPLQRGSRSRGL